MKNMLININIDEVKFGLDGFIEEINVIPKMKDVLKYRHYLKHEFINYQSKCKLILENVISVKDISLLIKYDVILYYILKMYKTDSTEDIIDFDYNINESDIYWIWVEMYGEEIYETQPTISNLWDKK